MPSNAGGKKGAGKSCVVDLGQSVNSQLGEDGRRCSLRKRWRARRSSQRERRQANVLVHIPQLILTPLEKLRVL